MSTKTVESVVASFVAELREVMRDQLLSSLAHWEVAPAKPVAPPARPKTASFVVKAPRRRTRRPRSSAGSMASKRQAAGNYISAQPADRPIRTRELAAASGLTQAQAMHALSAMGFRQKVKGLWQR